MELFNKVHIFEPKESHISEPNISLISLFSLMFNYAKPRIAGFPLKTSPKYTSYMTNITSDVSTMSVIFTEFTYFPRDVSETHTSLHSTELQLILHYATLGFSDLIYLIFYFVSCSFHVHTWLEIEPRLVQALRSSLVPSPLDHRGES